MADNSSERKKDSTSEEGVFVKHTSVDIEVIGFLHNTSTLPKKNEKQRQKEAADHHYLQEHKTQQQKFKT